MPWITKYNPDDLCPICNQEFTREKGVYKLVPCEHIFHNDCLSDYCEHEKGKIKCPLCRTDTEEYMCMDVWAFKNYALKRSSLPRNKHLLKMYDKNKPPSVGGKKTKRNGSKNRRTKRRGVNK
jgi:hypothetical protein